MSQKFQAAIHHRDDISFVKLTGVIDEDNELADGTSLQKPSRKQVSSSSHAAMTAAASPRCWTKIADPYSRRSRARNDGPKQSAASEPASTRSSEEPASSAPGARTQRRGWDDGGGSL